MTALTGLTECPNCGSPNLFGGMYAGLCEPCRTLQPEPELAPDGLPANPEFDVDTEP